MTQQLQTLIDNAWDNRASLSPAAAPKEIVDAVDM
jgi:2,3,4,5-tetrahydropyridine-2,6-dicarboxylate N-succinyltransferase (EC 2.3.1.117)